MRETEELKMRDEKSDYTRHFLIVYCFQGEAETQVAFEKHFNSELDLYGPICIVNLVEQAGKERIIWEAYSNHVMKMDNPDLIYATFDFHEYW